MRHLHPFLAAALAAALVAAAPLAHAHPGAPGHAPGPHLHDEVAPMPDYATRDDLVARYGAEEMDALAPADPGTGASPRADAALADAAADIEAHLAEGYDLPLPSGTWPLLTAVCCDLARLRLYDDAAPEHVLGRGSTARRRVRDLASGALVLLDAGGARVARRAAILVDPGTPVATRDRLAGYLGERG